MKCFAVIRADNETKLKTAISDLKKHANLEVSDDPKKIDSEKADDILVEVLDSPLKKECSNAAVCKLNENPATAINTIKGIHPPAHVFVVSDRYDVYDGLQESYNELDELNN